MDSVFSLQLQHHRPKLDSILLLLHVLTYVEVASQEQLSDYLDGYVAALKQIQSLQRTLSSSSNANNGEVNALN